MDNSLFFRSSMTLTPRQEEIPALVARGMSNKAIALRTGLAVGTVNEHIRHAADRIDLPGKPRHKLMVFALSRRAPS